jgi:hypothetical protein
MTVIDEVLASPRTEFITNDWPSRETAYCCLFVFMAVLPTFVANSPSGVPGSTAVPFDTNWIGTAMSLSSAAM